MITNSTLRWSLPHVSLPDFLSLLSVLSNKRQNPHPSKIKCIHIFIYLLCVLSRDKRTAPKYEYMEFVIITAQNYYRDLPSAISILSPMTDYWHSVNNSVWHLKRLQGVNVRQEPRIFHRSSHSHLIWNSSGSKPSHSFIPVQWVGNNFLQLIIASTWRSC